jgi:hypothetical protein
LNYSLPLPESTDEPSNKRTKLSDDAPSTIANKIEQGGYSSLRALQFDVDEISEHIIKQIREKETASISGSNVGLNTLRPADSELLARVLALQKVVKALVQDDATSHPPKSRNGIQTNGFNVNGVKLEGEDDELLGEGKPVLSIFANAQGPKQLFSSFQQDIKVGPGGHIESKELDESVEVTLPILESTLPSFITVSKRSNITSADKSADKRSQKLGERFGPPAGRQLPHLQVPKPSNKLLTKSGSVNWIPHETLSKATSIVRQSYNWPSMKQASGRWLSYSGVSSGQDPQSPEAKRRQRDRALSTGAAKLPQSEESLLAEEQAKEEALFRSVFSSFAPSVDNSGAIVPDHVKNEIWWDRVGRQRAEKVFIGPALLDEDDEEVEKEDFSEQDKVFEDIAKNFDPALLPSLDEEKKKDDEVDAKLQEITDLIETLYSYQKIRNSQLPSTSVPITPVGARQPLSEIIGTPDTPSASEMDVYKSLKTKLALCVLDLPPYAIAKLNGEKYGDPRAGGVQNYGGYPQTAPRPSYPAGAASYAAAGRPSFPQTPQYNPSQAQQAIAANRAPYSQYYQSSTPQTGYGRQYQQGAVPNYGQRPQSQQYGYTPQPTQSPNMRTASPMQQNASNPATQFNRTPSAQPTRTQFYGPPQASALGPSGFHTSMSPQEQQMLMDRQRAQVAIQNQARLTATPTANLPGTQPIPPYSPQRQVSGTPQPNPNFSQMNGAMGS